MRHREWVKERRLEKIRQAQEIWRDEDYGIKIAETPRGVRLTWTLDRDQFVALMALHQLSDAVLVRIESELVTDLRGGGVAWDEIGWALSLSRQAVQKRHRFADADARAAALGGEVPE